MRRGHEPQRTCAGCRSRDAKAALLRVVRAPGGEVTIDPGGRAPGRGGYVHPTPACIDEAIVHGGLGRALRTVVSGDVAGRLRGFGGRE